MVAVIQAGGKGTRLSGLTDNRTPKPLFPIAGIPILEHQIITLQRQGIIDIIVIEGFLGEQIEAYFENGSRWKVRIRYYHESEALGSAGALKEIQDWLQDDFLLIFGDLVFDVDIKLMKKFHDLHKAAVTAFVHPNTHPEDSDLVIIDDDSRITGILKKGSMRSQYCSNLVTAGIFILSKQVISRIKKGQKQDFVNDVLEPMLQNNCLEDKIYGYRSSEYVCDAGTIERFYQIEADLMDQMPQKRRLSVKQKCIFLDRDGVINRENGDIYKDDMFELEDCAGRAIKMINDSEFLAICVTNQPSPAKGFCSISDIRRIHQKMETLLGNEGAFLDDIEFCPHYPKSGFTGENIALKIECECRKPKIGMIRKLVDKYNIDLGASWIIGDRTVDIQTGINAGCHTMLVHTGVGGTDGKYNVSAECEAADLLSAVRQILQMNS